jgi:hypothetical protein
MPIFTGQSVVIILGALSATMAPSPSLPAPHKHQTRTRMIQFGKLSIFDVHFEVDEANREPSDILSLPCDCNHFDDSDILSLPCNCNHFDDRVLSKLLLRSDKLEKNSNPQTPACTYLALIVIIILLVLFGSLASGSNCECQAQHQVTVCRSIDDGKKTIDMTWSQIKAQQKCCNKATRHELHHGATVKPWQHFKHLSSIECANKINVNAIHILEASLIKCLETLCIMSSVTVSFLTHQQSTSKELDSMRGFAQLHPQRF